MMDEVQHTKDDVITTLEVQLANATTANEVEFIETKLNIIRKNRNQK